MKKHIYNPTISKKKGLILTFSKIKLSILNRNNTKSKILFLFAITIKYIDFNILKYVPVGTGRANHSITMTD